MPLALAAEHQKKESPNSESMVVDDFSSTPNSSGTVSEIFCSSHHPVTVNQWACFMNSVYVDPENKSDFRHLYHPEMFDDQNASSLLQVSITKQINKQASERKWTYSARSVRSGFFWTTVTNDGASPIVNITLDDAKRYCNWCEHGALHATSLEEALGMTESGVYDFTAEEEGVLINGNDSMQSEMGGKVAAPSDQAQASLSSNLDLHDEVTLSASKTTNNNSNNLFLGSLEAMITAQLSSYVLEAILNGFFLADPPAFVALEAGESLFPWLSEKFFPWIWKYLCKSCEPFTLPRNLVNAVLTLFNAAGMSTETTLSMKDDSWGTIALLTTESIVTMAFVEGTGALVEKPVEWLLNCLSINSGGNKAEAGWTLVRLFMNIYYIGAGAYFNVHSDIKNYQKQHPSS